MGIWQLTAILLIALTAFGQLKPKRDYCGSAIKKICGYSNHIGCNHQGWSRSCKRKRLITMDKKLIETILLYHNSYRSIVARGGGKSRKGMFPTAANMRYLEWDKELAYLASLNVKQCEMRHDQCRAVDVDAGQNLAYHSGFYAVSPLNSTKEFIKQWYNEIKNAATSDAYKYSGTGTGEINHFGQLAWGQTSRVGCAMAEYYQGSMKTHLFACNYAVKGNTVGQPMYKIGKPCSQCPNKTKCNEKFKLCVNIRNGTAKNTRPKKSQKPAQTKPTQSTTSAKPVTPAKSGKPATSIKPVTPTKPAKPGKTSKPPKPTKPPAKTKKFVPKRDYCAQDMQEKCYNRPHIGCKHNGWSTSCVNQTFIPMTRKLKSAALSVHNYLRSVVAQGGGKSRAGKFPQAADMHYLEWDDELAYLASLNVMQCTMAHDQCRAVDVAAGQNLAYHAGYYVVSPLNSTIEFIKSWYKEIKDAAPSDATKYSGRGSGEINHFGQLAWGQTSRVGCAMAEYYQGTMKTHLFACNYAVHGNIIDTPMYTLGVPCSKCPSKDCVTKYKLCRAFRKKK